MTVDLEANADTISTTMYLDGLGGKTVKTERKIYPNNPCPCGSGKKYKKCCGKKWKIHKHSKVIQYPIRKRLGGRFLMGYCA